MVVGDGPDRPALEAIAGSTIEFRGRLNGAWRTWRPFTPDAGDLVFPGEEDFGIVPLEANASGKPVVAFKAGGALDTVVDGRTGVYFADPSAAFARRGDRPVRHDRLESVRASACMPRDSGPSIQHDTSRP